ncbi:MAG: hypothetical protein ACPL5I_13290, partial [Thermodesulfobacteriota bacterium]
AFAGMTQKELNQFFHSFGLDKGRIISVPIGGWWKPLAFRRSENLRNGRLILHDHIPQDWNEADHEQLNNTQSELSFPWKRESRTLQKKTGFLLAQE